MPEKRGMLVHKMARSWDVAPALEKLQYLLAENRGKPIGANLENRLRELNLIRNWIAHGVSYTTTFLVEPDKQGSNSGFLVIDIEHSVNWQVKFPNTKFKMLEEIDHRDAEIAIKIVIDGLLLLTDAFEQPLLITNFEGERWYSIVFRDETNVGDLFFADD